MDSSSLYILYGFAITLLGGALWIAFQARRNQHCGLQFRTRLLLRIESLRLSKMLAYRGIDLTRYLYGEHTLDIKKNIFNCERCADLERCDEVLGGRRDPGGDFSFCPNREYLAALQAKLNDAKS